MLPPGIAEHFIPVRGREPEGTTLSYQPGVLGIGKVYYADGKAGVATEKEVTLLADFSGHPGRLDWGDALEVSITEDDLETFPDDEESDFGELPKEAGDKRSYTALSRSYVDFRIRLQVAAHEKRDMLIERLRKKYSSKITRLEDRIRRAEHAVEREREQAKQQKFQTAISVGATLLSALMGRKKLGMSTLGRASTAAGRAGRSMKEAKDIDRAEENLEELESQHAELQALLAEETEQIKATIDPLTEELETYVVKPKKKDISVSLVGLTWAPYFQDEKGQITQAW
jgi:hypothetical protein